MEIIVNEANFEQTVLSADKPFLLDFYATWCGPCKMLAPILEEFAKKHEGELTVGKADTDENPSLAVRFGVESIPTLLLFSNGKVIAKRIGYQTADALEKFILER